MLTFSFFKTIVVSLTIINDDPSLTIVNDDPSLTIVNITVNKNISKTIVFKNDRYLFSKSSKRVGRF